MWPTSAVNHVLKHLRRQGARHTVKLLVRRCLCGAKEFVITRASLAGPPIAERLGEIVFRLATRADLARLTEFDRYDRHGVMARASVEEDHDWLFVACHAERIVAMRLVGRNVPPHGIMHKVVKLAPGQVWEKEMFCLPEYRGRGIACRLSLFSDRHLAGQGYTELLGVVAARNIASLRMHVHKGVEFVCYVSYSRLLIHERLRISREIPDGLGLPRE
jgi:GNAT superfamily N-acetyltransferase